MTPADGEKPENTPTPAEGSSASAGKEEVSTAPAPAHAASGKPPAIGLWISEELDRMMLDYFNRYDIDTSGTINSAEELKQLCTNLVVKLELDMEPTTIDELCKTAGTNLDWPFEKFKKWYLELFQPLPSWQPNDASESDEDMNDGKLRQGTYDLVLDQGEAAPFRLRYGGTEDTLFTRTANDEGVGYDKSGTPLGLHELTGAFDYTNKTCSLVKTYKHNNCVVEFKGKIESQKKISGTYTASGDLPAGSGLKGSGAFTMDKRPKED
jgi:hypothetical protein